ncbi:MAG TPA: hypothetical protein VFU51_01650 [Gaiellaceae bacterium]|jgi:uncharacterized Ntn-hydrolase superfamily protein|nr:hypothetical protein [Gaiellaceae bacterium]
MFGRSRYTKVIDAQLELFVRDHRDVIEEARRRLELYNSSDRTDAEELYGDYVDAVEAGTEILADMRDHYAATVDDADGYAAAFNRAVAKRVPEFSLEIENR